MAENKEGDLPAAAESTLSSRKPLREDPTMLNEDDLIEPRSRGAVLRRCTCPDGKRSLHDVPCRN